METKLFILHGKQPDEEDEKLYKIVNFLGISYEIIDYNDNDDFFNYLKIIPDNYKICIVINNKTISAIYKYLKNPDLFINLFFKKISYLYIYSINPAFSDCKDTLRYISDGEVDSISEFNSNDHKYYIQPHNELTRELSDQSFGPINNKIDYFLNIKNKKNITTIISIDNNDFFIFLKKHNCQLFIAASSKFIDIEQEIYENDSVKNYFSQFMPVMIFLKYVFKTKCWHNPDIYANFIIDDLLLRKQYGCINYYDLLKSMNKSAFSSTIAFIPWNYKRTNKKIARLFCEEKQKLNICIHGCNHTAREFETTDYIELNQMIKEATTKINIHNNLTSIECEKIFTFPQGIFSSQSMKMLKINNYLSAVNSTEYSTEIKQIKIKDLLDIAVLIYDCFPLFRRRYPHSEIIEFAIDAFLGKPILLVEHHNYFKNGYQSNEAFIRQINSLSKRIKWRGLSDIIKKTYKKREGPGDLIFYWIFSGKVIINNNTNVKKNLIIQKKETVDVKIESLQINGKNTIYSLHKGLLEIKYQAEPYEEVFIEIKYIDTAPFQYIKKSKMKMIKIFLRRILCEFRDNVIIKTIFNR